MIPYFEYHNFDLGLIKMQAWGLMVALGFLVSLGILYKTAIKKGLDWGKIINIFLGIFISSFVFARLFYVWWGGQWRSFVDNPASIFAIWNGGLSSFGGFFGAVIFFFSYFKIYKLPLLKYADALIYALPFGWVLGRLGCFLIHDHKGILSNSFLAINFPGGSRFDMALLEILALLPLLIFFLVLSKKEQKIGIYTIWFLLWYGTARFFLDFLRAADVALPDPHYLNLTIAQWGSIILVILGFYLLKSKIYGREIR